MVQNLCSVTLRIFVRPSRSIIMITLYHPKSKGQTKNFVDTLKRALKKARSTPTGKALQQFLQVYRITPNNKRTIFITPAEVMFVCKIRSVFHKLLPKQNLDEQTLFPKNTTNLEKKVFFRIFCEYKSFGGNGYNWEKSWEYDPCN